MEQAHKTNPIIQEHVVSLSNSPSLSFCLLWNNFSASLHKAHLFWWLFCAPNPFFLYFVHAVVDFKRGVVILGLVHTYTGIF